MSPDLDDGTLIRKEKAKVRLPGWRTLRLDAVRDQSPFPELHRCGEGRASWELGPDGQRIVSIPATEAPRDSSSSAYFPANRPGRRRCTWHQAILPGGASPDLAVSMNSLETIVSMLTPFVEVDPRATSCVRVIV